MIKLKLSNTEVQEYLSGKKYIYPKYATQIINLANQNAQGTRPKVVGQMSSLIQEFVGETMQEWEIWYKEKQPEAIDKATDKILAMVKLLQETIATIDRDTVRDWVEEFIVVKTFSGLKFQEAILSKISLHYNKSFRLAEPAEESKGIDGYLGETAISIKPGTYKLKSLNESIAAPIIYYVKTKGGFMIEFDESLVENS